MADAEAVRLMELFLPSIGEGEDKSSPFVNRLRKNYRHIRKWARRTGSDSFRIYDRDLHHYPLSIDYYGGRYCVQYFAARRGAEEPPAALVQEVEEALRLLLNADQENIYWRTRFRRRRTEQYEKADGTQQFFTVREYGVAFKVNLRDYLDTGLFLDHRETRRLVAARAAGKRVLNLFAYTCSFSVHCAVAGAAFTKSVDLSNTYTAWGRDNFELNGLPAASNPIVRADCLKFLKEERGALYDIIIIDPPTLSRSKKMDQLFDIQRDYVTLLHDALRLLAPGGVLYFSCNLRSFVFDAALFPRCKVEDISAKTIPLDFHDPQIHRCWRLTVPHCTPKRD